jgi:hypothetical protein
LRSSPSVRKTKSEIPSGLCTRPEFYTRSAATTRPWSRRKRGSFVVKGLFRFLQIPRLLFSDFCRHPASLSRNLNGRTFNQCGGTGSCPLKLYARMNLPSFVTFAKANEKLTGRMHYGSFCDHGPRPGRSLRPCDLASGKVPVLVLELNHLHRRRLRVPPAYCQIICSFSAFSRARRGCENYGLNRQICNPVAR